MGCKICKGQPTLSSQINGSWQETQTSKQYSWDKKERVNPSDFTIENIDGESVGRLPNSIKGQQFIIQNCENSAIYLFDHINTVTIDDCTNCSIVVGPTKGSVFVRNCKDCRLVVACQQFRSRDCQRIDTFLCCTTHPIIEASTQMRFGCYSYSYSELENQFRSAGLSIFNNDWYDVRDFTPSEEDCNWSILSKDCRIEDYIPLPLAEELAVVEVSNAPVDVMVPYTYGIRQRVSKEFSFVAFFGDGYYRSAAHSYLQDLKTHYPDVRLLRTKEIKMTIEDVKRVFQTDKCSSVVEDGLVLGMEYNGDESTDACQKTAIKAGSSTGLLYVAGDSKTAKRQLNVFFDLKDMQMSG